MSEAELVIDQALDNIPGTVPRLSQVSIERLDNAVTEITSQAESFECKTDADYLAGDKAVQRIRSLDKLFENTYKPLKDWWAARQGEARADEQARRGPLETAKKLYGERMLAWKSERDKRATERKRLEDEQARQRAEELRLSEAAKKEEEGNRTGNQALKDEAVAMLDRPLDIVPTFLPPSTPKLGGGRGGTKVVKQQVVVGVGSYDKLSKDGHRLTDAEWDTAREISGRDIEDLIICIGASLIVYDREAPEPVKAYLKQFASRMADPLALSANTKWLTTQAIDRGEAFSLGGVKRVIKERLG